MRIENYTDYMDRHRHRNITFIGTDDSDYQLDYLATGYVDGLVGQMPYSIGMFILFVIPRLFLSPFVLCIIWLLMCYYLSCFHVSVC